jgi:hypothetical protein
VSTEGKGRANNYCSHPTRKLQRYLHRHQKVTAHYSLILTDFDTLAPCVLFSFGDVTVIDIRRWHLWQTDFRAGRHRHPMHESEQVL